MKRDFKVVDLFAGPGGLAEGFSGFQTPSGHLPFKIVLSVEKESSAFATLRLRSFVRQFHDKIPGQYYDYIAGNVSHGELTSAFPREWQAACLETMQLELGKPGSDDILNPVLDGIRQRYGKDTILIGGPPCQAYSLVGRARNRGIANYVASEDHRNYLYKQYIDIIGRLQPAAFIMENVKGILSAKIGDERIFPKVLDDLQNAGGAANSYILIPLVSSSDHRGSEHVIETERFGIPQCRHRVILFGVRRDIAMLFPEGLAEGARLKPAATPVTVRDVLSGMPRLRSGLSRMKDTPEEWAAIALAAFRDAAAATSRAGDGESDNIAQTLLRHAVLLESSDGPRERRSKRLATIQHPDLANWLLDPKLTALSNHETRGHMPSDLSRYAFASVFAEQHKRSPKAAEYPADLAPAHMNWLSGKFSDRFRVQRWDSPSTTVTSHISKDGHYFIHPDPMQCRSLTVREAARLQTFPDNYHFEGNRTEQFVQVGNAVPPLLARQIAEVVHTLLGDQDTAGDEKPASSRRDRIPSAIMH